MYMDVSSQIACSDFVDNLLLNFSFIFITITIHGEEFI